MKVEEKERENARFSNPFVLFLESADVYFEKYRKSRVEFQMARRKWQMETEEEVETVVREKKAIERKLSEALAEVEVLNDHLSSLRLKANRIEGNSADIELQLEGALERNAELEKKQKKSGGALIN